jgi:hypothetical protein
LLETWGFALVFFVGDLGGAFIATSETWVGC